MLNRFNGHVVPFADNATGTNRTVFGDVAQSDNIDDNLNADFKLGWEIVGINDNPTKQDFNALAYTLGNLVSYLYQQGIAAWNTTQKYYVGSRCIGSDGLLYKALTGTEPSPNTGNDPVSDSVNWKQLSADEVKYDNTASDLTATDAQAAIDELDSEVGILNFLNSKATNGYQKLPNGLIIQWGVSTVLTQGSNTINYPISFTTTGFMVVSGGVGASTVASAIHSATLSVSQFYLYSESASVRGGSWVAIGY